VNSCNGRLVKNLEVGNCGDRFVEIIKEMNSYSNRFVENLEIDSYDNRFVKILKKADSCNDGFVKILEETNGCSNEYVEILKVYRFFKEILKKVYVLSIIKILDSQTSSFNIYLNE